MSVTTIEELKLYIERNCADSPELRELASTMADLGFIFGLK